MSTAGTRQAVRALGIPDSGCSSFIAGLTGQVRLQRRLDLFWGLKDEKMFLKMFRLQKMGSK